MPNQKTFTSDSSANLWMSLLRFVLLIVLAALIVGGAGMIVLKRPIIPHMGMHMLLMASAALLIVSYYFTFKLKYDRTILYVSTALFVIGFALHFIGGHIMTHQMPM
jgi:hypothetical protein